MALNFAGDLFKESPDDGQVKVFGTDETYQDFLDEVAILAADAAVKAVIALETGTYYWMISGVGFKAKTDGETYQTTGRTYVCDSAQAIIAVVSGIPDGAVVTEVEVIGSAGTNDETWTLIRHAWSGGGAGTMATAACNTADTSISNATIDNNTYAYSIYTSTLTAGDEIYGARIKYTLS